jgi:hypothetical protein
MAGDADDIYLIGSDETAFRLDMTAAQMKITWTALHSLLDDFGHEEADVQQLIRDVLSKFPDEHAIRAIDIGQELSRRRAHE